MALLYTLTRRHMIFFSKSYMTTLWTEKQIHVPNFIAAFHTAPVVFQGSKIALVRSYIRVPQAAGQE